MNPNREPRRDDAYHCNLHPRDLDVLRRTDFDQVVAVAQCLGGHVMHVPLSLVELLPSGVEAGAGTTYLLQFRARDGRKRPGIVALHQTTKDTIDEIAGVSGPRDMWIGENLVYSPEFVALGNVVRGMARPEVVLVGSRSAEASERVGEFWGAVVATSPAFVLTGLASAEVAKLGLNTLVATKVTCANLLAEICQELPGADIDAVTETIGSDSRIGRKYLRGGLGFGGPCFPRDVKALSALCRDLGVEASLADAVTDTNG